MKILHFVTGLVIGIVLTILFVNGFRVHGEYLPRCYANMSANHCYTVSSEG